MSHPARAVGVGKYMQFSVIHRTHFWVGVLNLNSGYTQRILNPSVGALINNRNMCMELNGRLMFSQ